MLTRQGQREEGKEEEMGGKSSKNDFSNQVVALLHSYIAHCGAWLTRKTGPCACRVQTPSRKVDGVPETDRSFVDQPRGADGPMALIADRDGKCRTSWERRAGD